MTTQFQRSAADWCSAARMRVRGPENGWLPHLQSALVTTMAGFDDPGQAMTWFLPSSAALTDPVIASFQHIGLTADGFAHDLLVESACRGLARAAIAGEAVIDARWAKVGRRSTDGATTPPYPTLRLADARYTAGHHRHFGYFSKTSLSWKTKLELRIDAHAASFLEDAARGSLPSVSWIDPAFTTFNPLGFPPNDDHAPADISDGQDLVLAVYDALAASPGWDRSLLVIVYDEHGGFYDHVPPPQAPDDDPATFGRYGVRVPAIVVSPWVEPRSVSSTVFDHTSIIKSVLLRFCPQALNPPARDRSWRLRTHHPTYPGARVAHAAHLGELLTRTAPRPAPRRDPLVMDAAARVAEQAKAGHGATGQAGPGEHEHTDLQKGFLAAAHELARLGHPGGKP